MKSTDPTVSDMPESSITRQKITLFDGLLVFHFSLILLIMSVAIFFRYVINQSLSWSDEAVRYLFVWFTLLGSSAVLRDRTHIRVEFFLEMVSPKIRKFLDFVSDSLILAFNVILLVLGLKWFVATTGTQTATLHLPINIALYAALPVSAFLNLVFLLFSGGSEEPASPSSE